MLMGEETCYGDLGDESNERLVLRDRILVALS
jgi:hypothetical protein